MAMLVAQSWLKGGNPVYLVTPNEESAIQVRSLAFSLGVASIIDGPSKVAPRSHPMVISTYAAAWRRNCRRNPDKTLLVLDECHHVNYSAPVNREMLIRFPNAVGMSASPWSRGCIDYFQKNRYTYRLSEAISEGYCAEFDLKPWTEPTNGPYQLIYTNNGKLRSELISRLQQSDYVLWNRSDSKRIITKFRYGAINTLVLNRMLTEGFDQPEIKRIWIERRTQSRIAAMQMAGRSLRPYNNRRATVFCADEELAALLDSAFRLAS